MVKGSVIGLAAIACFALAGCDGLNVSFGHHGGHSGQGLKGSGNLKTETRKVADFHALKAGGALHVNLTVGPATSFKIEGEDNILPLIKSEVKDGQLEIYAEGRFNAYKEITVTITTPKIDALDVSGASELDATGIDAVKLTVDFSGASHVKLDGHANSITGELSGASELKAKGSIDNVELDLSGASGADLLKAPGKKAKVTLSGASTMKVIALDGIEADLSGASNLSYKASQNVHVDKSGASNAEKID